MRPDARRPGPEHSYRRRRTQRPIRGWDVALGLDQYSNNLGIICTTYNDFAKQFLQKCRSVRCILQSLHTLLDSGEGAS